MTTDVAIRRATATATLTVAVASAVLSYAGLRDMGLAAGFSPALAVLLPVAVDGMVVAGMLGVLHATLAKSSAAYSWLLVILGLGFSVYGNVSQAETLSDRLAHGVAPVALALSLEALVATTRRRVVDERAELEAAERARRAAERAQARAAQPQRPRAASSRSRLSAEQRQEILDLHRAGGLTGAEIARHIGTSPATVSRVVTKAQRDAA